jgi:hypothetical protein
MTDNGHTDHEQLTRRLHEQGQAQAPADLAGDVMRRVRAEPRQQQRAWLRPVALCAAIVVLLAASVAGLARIGGSQSGSAASSVARAGMGGGGVESDGNAIAKAPQTLSGAATERHVAGVPTDKLATLSPLPFCPAHAHAYALRVPAGRYADVSRQLQAWAAAGPAGATTNNVLVHRAPASARLALTCP